MSRNHSLWLVAGLIEQQVQPGLFSENNCEATVIIEDPLVSHQIYNEKRAAWGLAVIKDLLRVDLLEPSRQTRRIQFKQIQLESHQSPPQRKMLNCGKTDDYWNLPA